VPLEDSEKGYSSEIRELIRQIDTAVEEGILNGSVSQDHIHKRDFLLPNIVNKKNHEADNKITR